MATPKTTAKKSGDDSQSSARATALSALAKLSVAEVQREPAYRTERLSWLRTLVPLVAKDHDGLIAAPLDPALTKPELEIFPELVTLIGEADAGCATEAATAKVGAKDAAKIAALRGHQAKLDRAFRLRLRDDKSALKVLAEIRRGEPGDPEDMLSDARQLVALADDPKHKGWVSALKKGEPEAVVALKEAIPDLEALSNSAAGKSRRRPTRDQLRRAFTVALRLADRIVAAGEYHTSDLAGREGDYKRFQRPAPRKPRKK